jgi:hypothetical protein
VSSNNEFSQVIDYDAFLASLRPELWYPAVPACRPEGMAAVRQYRFRILVTPAPAAREGTAQRLPSRVRALTAYACCLIQPAYHHEYFPAMISWDEELPPSPAAHAMMIIALADGEAAAFFALGQGFTVWADGTVGRTVRAEGLAGYGVISGQISPLPAGVVRDRIHRGSAGPDRGHRLAAVAASAAAGRRGPGDARLPGMAPSLGGTPIAPEGLCHGLRRAVPYCTGQ